MITDPFIVARLEWPRRRLESIAERRHAGG